MKILKASLPLLLIALSLSSCKKDTEENPDPHTEVDTELEIRLYHEWGNEAFVLDQVYSINGVDVKFSELRYYLSGFSVENDDMSMTNSFPDKILLVDAAGESNHLLGELSLHHLHMIYFSIGLDAETNHQDPTLAAPPLNDINMHWSWNPDSGYKFVKVEGESDPDGDGIFEPFSIHVATDALLRPISSLIHDDVSGPKVSLHAHVAVNEWFQQLDFSNLSGTHGNGSSTVALMDGAQGSFNFE